MALVFTGEKRSLYFMLNKTVDGVTAQGYPVPYNGQVSWGNALYPTLTDAQAKALTDTEFNDRLTAFLAWVEAKEDGFDASENFTNEAIVTDTDTCPPPPTTTTTL